jgi:hypothetical protein
MSVPPHSAPGNGSHLVGTVDCPRLGCGSIAGSIGAGVYKCAKGHKTCGTCCKRVNRIDGRYVCESGCAHG